MKLALSGVMARDWFCCLHAKAEAVWVRIGQEEGVIRVTIEDDGCGGVSERAQGQHFGLQTMRERAEAVGGTRSVESPTGQGTRVIARFPVGP